MGLKVIVIAAMLGLIATSGHAFAYEPQSRDGLWTTGLAITLRKANAIRIAPPKPTRPVWRAG